MDAGAVPAAPTGPGKAAKAAMAIEARRRERRAAAEAEKAARDADVAEHGDKAHVVPRRMIAQFRQEVAVGARVYGQPGQEGGQGGGHFWWRCGSGRFWSTGREGIMMC